MIKVEKSLCGFTLAEILITLGIIGIVAAMTIPTLINNASNAEYKTAYKKVYSNMTQAYNAVTQENGGTPYSCYYNWPTVTWLSSECTAMWTAMANKLKVAKTYSGAVDGVNIPDYIAVDSGSFPGTVVGACYAGRIAAKASKEAWILADGSMLISYFATVSGFSGFILDVNGLRKPNKWGYDIYLVSFNNYSAGNYQIRLDDGVCPTYQTGGFRTNDILLNK